MGFRVILSLCLLQLISVNGKICRFGPDCLYNCNCEKAEDCNSETGCQSKCARGWLGKTCQAENVALGRPAEQNPYSDGYGRYASLAVDGRRGHTLSSATCTHAGAAASIKVLPEWNVTLEQEYNIYRFIIDNRADCCGWRLNRFILSVGQSSVAGNNYRECYKDDTPGNSTSPGPGDTITAHCNNNTPIKGDIVQIRIPNYYPLTLCEVMIYVCSRGWYGEGCNKECVSSDYCAKCDPKQVRCEECVPGKWGKDCAQSCYCLYGAKCDRNKGRCPGGRCAPGYEGNTCTSSCSPGTFGPDCVGSCGECIGGQSDCLAVTGDCLARSPRCKAGYKGSRCDQECPGGLYGSDCAHRCGQCTAGSEKCDRVTGNCPEGQIPRCTAGWYGEQCKTECPPGEYGANCAEVCGQCADGQDQCDAETGHCPLGQQSRCAAGWDGERCKTECPAGKYGADCTEICGQCASGQDQCDGATGNCPMSVPSRCTAGWGGDRCKTKCPGGAFGEQCTEECGQCAEGNNTCDHVTGACIECAAGRKGILCKQVCLQGTWGRNCNGKCSPKCKNGSTSCDIVTGDCNGCKDGYTGRFCEPVTNTWTILGSVLGVTLGVLAVTVVICVFYRRRSRCKPYQQSSVPQGHRDEQHSAQGHIAIGPERSSEERNPNHYENAVTFNVGLEPNNYEEIRYSQLDPDYLHASMAT